MSLPALQDDSNVPSSKKFGGNPYCLNHILVHVDGASDGTANGKWSYDTASSHKIKYNSTSKKWEDLADSEPAKISDTYNVNTSVVAGSSTGANPAEVFLWNNNGGQFLGQVANPFYTAPSGSGGTSTEGGENGSITYLNNVLTWTIDSSSQTATSYKLFRDSTEVMSAIGHTTGSLTTGTVSNPLSGVWTLVYNAIPFASVTVTSGSVSSSKKVFCNFW